jgi:hypothetical protein
LGNFHEGSRQALRLQKDQRSGKGTALRSSEGIENAIIEMYLAYPTIVGFAKYFSVKRFISGHHPRDDATAPKWNVSFFIRP